MSHFSQFSVAGPSSQILSDAPDLASLYSDDQSLIGGNLDSQRTTTSTPGFELDIAKTQKTQTQPNPNPTQSWVWVRNLDPTLGFGLQLPTQTQRWGPKENPENPNVGANTAKVE
jgi:hypothetical protein